LKAWVRAAPLEALAHADVVTAVLAQAPRADAAPLIALLEARLSPSEAPPPVGAHRRHR
jgi:hypothetical protein